MNELMGERLSIITQKAQTTRHRILGVVSEEDYQKWLSEARVKFAKEEIENDKLKLVSK